MNPRYVFIRRAFFTLCCCLPMVKLMSADYYLGTNGDDANPGTSAERPFATLAQVGKILQPGDTVIFLPGEYHQELHLSFAGHRDRPTTFKAAIRGTVHLRGDQPAPAFSPSPERREVFYCQVEQVGLREQHHLYPLF